MGAVFPALVLNYLGQASLTLRNPALAKSSFFGLVPAWAQLPMVILATIATIIASQAVISGTYSVVHQAWRLGLFPPLRVIHTSENTEGQIYVPAINVILAVAVLGVTIGFRGSAALASAYGIAVTTTISITTIVYLAWNWAHSRRLTARMLAASGILLIVIAFLIANLPKAASGGWLPLVIGVIVFTVMSSWWIGQQRIRVARRVGEMPIGDLESFLIENKGSLTRVPGDAVFITRNPEIVPVALRTMVTRNHALQKRVFLLSWSTANVPSTVGMKHRLRVETFPSGIVRVVAKIGFREHPRMTELMTEARTIDKTALVDFAASRATFFISIPVPRYNPKSKMFRGAQMLFLALDRLAPDPLDLIELPRDGTIVLGREALL